MVLFKDLAKESSDLLTYDFPHDKPWNIEAKHKSTGSKTEFTNSCSCSRTGTVKAATAMKYNQQGLKGELKVGQDGLSLFDVCYLGNKYVEGLTAGTRVEQTGKAKALSEALEVYVDYSTPRFRAKTFLNPLGGTFNTSATVTCNQPNPVILGAELSGGLDAKTLKYTLGASYTQRFDSSKWTLALRSMGRAETGLNEVTCNLHTRSTGEKRGPSELSVEATQGCKGGAPHLQMGGLWYIGQNKESSLKAKIDQHALLSLAISHTFSPSLTAILGIQMDATKFAAAEPVKYGVKFVSTA